jgi:hypothetical protein
MQQARHVGGRDVGDRDVGAEAKERLGIEAKRN